MTSNLYVIWNVDQKKYVAFPGSENSFTSFLQRARTFVTYENAKAECCGNEHPVRVDEVLCTPTD